MTLSTPQLIETFSPLVNHIASSAETDFTGISPVEDIQPETLVFLSKPKQLELVLQKMPKGLVTSKDLATKAQELGYEGALFESPAVTLAMAKVALRFFPVEVEKQPFDGESIHSSAVISKTAKLGENVRVGPNSVIGPNTVIEDNVFVGANSTIEADCHIGEGSFIRSQVFIGFGTLIGKNCEIQAQTAVGTEGFGFAQDDTFTHHHIPHRGHVVIEDNVHVGAGCTLDRGTFGASRFGEGTIIDNICHFGHNFTCGKKCIFTGGNLVAGSVTIGDMCVFGGRVTINGHINIASRVRVGGVSGVVNHITEPGEYGGFPVQKYKDFLRTLSSLPYLASMRKQLKELANQ